MTVDRIEGGHRAQCERCGLTTPRMHTATDEAVEQILRAAGWSTRGVTALCPRCRTLAGEAPGAGRHSSGGAV